MEAELKRGKTMPKDWTMPKDAVSIVDITVGDGVTLCVDVDKGLSFVHMRTRTHTHACVRAHTHTHTHTQ